MSSPEETRVGYPCLFKQQCHGCDKVTIQDRPFMCINLKCQYYTPCPGCQENRTLHDTTSGKRCKECIKKSKKLQREFITEKEKSINNGAMQLGLSTGNGAGNTGPEIRTISITSPGEPPLELDQAEKTYYLERWGNFKGYYRNPSAYFVCHLIILQEIQITYLTSKRLQARGYLNEELTNQLNTAVSMLKKMNEQLPSKEAEDVMDDEKSLAMIYDAYKEETRIRYAGGVARILSPAALALAPRLDFPIDPFELLTNLGFSFAEAEDAIRNVNMPSAEYTPQQILEHFGFHLTEEFAQPLASPLVSPLSDAQLTEEDERLD